MNSLAPSELKQWMKEDKPFILVDVREGFERERYHIGGAHIPMNEIIGRREELVNDLPVVLYCEKGIRSGIVIQRLESFGLKGLYNLEGGMSAWRKLPENQ